MTIDMDRMWRMCTVGIWDDIPDALGNGRADILTVGITEITEMLN